MDDPEIKIHLRNKHLNKQAKALISFLRGAPFEGALKVYRHLFKNDTPAPILRTLCRYDLFFLLTIALRRMDAIHPWVYDRCREVEAKEQDVLDVWARGHYKSTIKTFARNIQRVLVNPDVTISIFSHTGQIARGFLSQIKRELEDNDFLKALFPKILYANPKKDSPLWSLQAGLIVRRKSNPKEATFEAWGLVDSQPVSKHFEVLCYDDVVSVESVSTPEQIQKTTIGWELSQSLGPTNKPGIRVYAGTRYNFADTYKTMIDRGVVETRIHTATNNGKVNGKPVLFTDDKWDKIKKSQSGYTVACQYMQNPIAGSEQEFKPDWIRYYHIRPEVLNVAILVDPANSKKKGTSNTAMAVMGLDTNGNKYLLDGMRHKMGLKERWENLKRLRNKWVKAIGVQVLKVGYEKYGMQSDLEHFNEMMKLENCYFPIEEVSWVAGSGTSQIKDDRIRRLIPDHQNWRFFYPYGGQKTKKQKQYEEMGKSYLIPKPIKNVNHERKVYDLVDDFISNEYLFFPSTTEKDFLDAMSRIYDLKMPLPMVIPDDFSLVPDFMAAGDY